MDKELIAAIEAAVCEIWRIKQRIKSDREAGNTPPDYLRKHLRHLDRQLNQMRSVAVYYKEYSSIEDLHPLPAYRHCQGWLQLLHARSPFLLHINTLREILSHPEPVDIALFTAKGEIQHYKNCISLRYDFRNGTRRIKLLSSGQIRQVRDVCIFQINGMEVFL